MIRALPTFLREEWKRQKPGATFAKVKPLLPPRQSRVFSQSNSTRPQTWCYHFPDFPMLIAPAREKNAKNISEMNAYICQRRNRRVS
jgi:hypothetical protein